MDNGQTNNASLGPERQSDQSTPAAPGACVYVGGERARCSPHPLAMGRRFSIHRNAQFQYVYRRGKSYPARGMVLIYLRGKGFKVGFSVSSKIGNAVVRNRVKRRMREQLRLIRPELKQGQYIFVARGAIVNQTSKDIAKTMAYLLNQANFFKEKNP